MWTISIILASPMVYFTNIESFMQPNTKVLINRCTEYDPDITMRKIKLAYSTMSVIIQYVAPLFTVITVYTRIFFKIKRRMVNQTKSVDKKVDFHEEPSSRMVMNVRKRKQVIEQKRQRRTNILLFCIALIFALSWLPINIVNLMMDIMLVNPTNRQSNGFQALSSRSVKTIQAVCLLIVLCSACTNPLLYSWLNVSFKEKISNAICCFRKPNNSLQSGNGCFKRSIVSSQLMSYNPKPAKIPLNGSNKPDSHPNVDDSE